MRRKKADGGITCPICGATQIIVIDSRAASGRIRRRRSCENGHRFSTVELPIDDKALHDLWPKKKVEKTCRKCKAMFVAEHGNSRYCGTSCLNAARQENSHVSARAHREVLRQDPRRLERHREKMRLWMQSKREDAEYRERERQQQRRYRSGQKTTKPRAKIEGREFQATPIVHEIRRPTMTATGLRIGDSVPLRGKARRSSSSLQETA